MSRVVQLILEAEHGAATSIGRTIRTLDESTLSRYQYLDRLLQVCSGLARLKRVRQDDLYDRLSRLPRSQAKAEAERLLTSRPLPPVQEAPRRKWLHA